MSKRRFTIEEAIAAMAVLDMSGVDPASAQHHQKVNALTVTAKLSDSGHSQEEILLAAEHGMKHVWPFSEGNPWDMKDFLDNFSKALSAARKLKRCGEVPSDPPRGEPVNEDEVDE